MQFIASVSYQSIQIDHTNNAFTSIETQNELFIHFSKLIKLYLTIKKKLRNKTNHGIVVFWSYIGLYILLSIYNHRSC